MRLNSFCLVAFVWLGVANAALAGHTKKYFPLNAGNTWTYHEQVPWGEVAGIKTMSILQYSNQTARLKGFPNVTGSANRIWVKFIGHDLYAWNPSQGKYVPFLRFGAPKGTSYVVNLDVADWNNITVWVESKNASVANPILQKSFKGCIKLKTSFSTFDAGLDEMFFAPHVGLVGWTSSTFGGPVNAHLKSAKVNGGKIGLVGFTSLSDGTDSFYPLQGKNKVLLFNSKTSWAQFYMKHAPGSPVPGVDFAKKTVLVALAGERPTAAFKVQVHLVRWDYPTSSGTRVVVHESNTSGAAFAIAAMPFEIVVLDEKVYSATIEWKPKPLEPGPPSA